MAAHKQDNGFKVKINLLIPQGNVEKLAGKSLKWLLSYGQYIAILAAIILFIIFFIQYRMEGELSSINQQINQQIDHIDSLSPQLVQIGNLQVKLTDIKGTYTNTPDWQGFFSSLADQVPTGVRLVSMTIDHSSPPSLLFKITGTSDSNNDVAVFIKGLRNNTPFKDIVLTNLSLDQNQYDFSITGEQP